MSFSTARRDIANRLNSNWGTTNIAYDNVEFKVPAGNVPWIRLRIFEDFSERINIGTPGIHRANGTIVLEIFTEIGKGSETGRSYADTLAAIYRDAQFNGITCRSASVEIVGEMGGWWKTTVSIPFFWDGSY